MPDARITLTINVTTYSDSVSVEIHAKANGRHVRPLIALERFLEEDPKAVAWLREIAESQERLGAEFERLWGQNVWKDHDDRLAPHDRRKSDGE